LLEAITTGCAVVASNTAPVKEFLSEGPRSRLVDFFDVEQLKMATVEMLGESRKKEGVRPMLRQEENSIDSVQGGLHRYKNS
jgi:hypothetical protein